MSKFLKVTFVTVLILAIMPWQAQAQVSRTGSLEGRVTDTAGLPLPGVTVTINSEALIRKDLAVQTDLNGRYRFLSIPPGAYQMKFELAGFQTAVQENIRVSLSAATNLNVTLTSGVTEEVTVIAERPVVDVKEVSLTTNIPQEFLQDIPVTREVLDFIEMTPGYHSETAHGSSEQENSINLDGMESSDPWSGGISSNFSIDIVEEISVQMGGLKAEHRTSRGAVVNIHTKSGGNKLSGSIGAHFADKALQSDNSAGTPFEGQEVGIDHEYSASGTLGAPIVRDKLWFFGAFEYIDRSDFEEGFPFDNPSEIALKDSDLFTFGKLTWQIAPQDTLILSINYRKNDEPYDGASDTRNIDSTSTDDDTNFVGSLNYRKTFGSNILMDTQVGYLAQTQEQISNGRSPTYQDRNTGFYTRGDGRDRGDNEYRFNIFSDFTYLIDDWIGSHEIKAGVSADWVKTDRYDKYLEGEHTYPGMPGKVYRIRTRGDNPYDIRFRIDFSRKVNYDYYGAYIQDTWNPTPRLVLNLGVRVDSQYGYLPPAGADREKLVLTSPPGDFFYDPEFTERIEVVKETNISPRLGAVLDLTGDGKTVVKASYGRLYARGLATFVDEINPNDVIEYYYRLNPDYSLDFDRGWYSVRAGVNRRTEPDLKTPYMDEITLGIERELVPDLSLGFRYIRKWDRRMMDDVVENMLDYDRLMSTGELVWTNFEPVQGTDPVTGNPITFWSQIDEDVIPELTLTNPPGLERNYTGFELTLDKQMSNNWMARASYVYGKSTGNYGLTGSLYPIDVSGELYNDPNAHTNMLGRDESERRHQIRFNASYRGPWGIMGSTFIKWWSGQRYNRFVNSDDVGVDLQQGDWDVLAEPRGSYGLPSQLMVDIRLEKAFSISNVGRVRLSADFFNLLNANTVTNVQEISSNPNIEFGAPRDILYPRQIRFNVIFEF
jgi:outer membrane receptor protein involved in Fe transport